MIFHQVLIDFYIIKLDKEFFEIKIVLVPKTRIYKILSRLRILRMYIHV